MYFIKFHRRNTYALITYVAQNSLINLERSKNKISLKILLKYHTQAEILIKYFKVHNPIAFSDQAKELEQLELY